MDETTGSPAPDTTATAYASADVPAAQWTVGDDGLRLFTSRCTACDLRWFPTVDMCPSCASTVIAPDQAGPLGTAYASTVVRAGARGFRAPYVLSYVDVDGVRILTHVKSDSVLPPGTPVRLVAGEIGDPDVGTTSSYVAVVAQDAPVENAAGAKA
jgi:uncharacterized OB-fold protein